MQCQECSSLASQSAVLLQSASKVVQRFTTLGQVLSLQPVVLEEDPDVPPVATPTLRTNITCHSRVYASQIEPGVNCPDSCPFWAEEVGDHLCQFQCVRSSECGLIDPEATVVDQQGMYCRACIVPGCDQCSTGGGDFCMKCRDGYTLFQGDCLSPYRYFWYALYVIIAFVVAYLTWWYFDLRFKKIRNEAGLQQGLRFKSRTRLHMPAEEGNLGRSLWPLTTNLLKEPVAGPGLCLFFNYQLAVIVWAFCMAAGWLFMSSVVSWDLMILGTKQVATPQQLCTVTTWGFRTQHLLMWAKIRFMCTAYIVTFVASIAFAAIQHRRFGTMDNQATMKDYAALVSKLPKIRGDFPEAEEDLRVSLQQATGEDVVGVCICWDIAEKVDELRTIIEEDTEREQRRRPSFSKLSLPFGEPEDVVEAEDFKEESQCFPLVGMARASFDALNGLLGFHYQDQEPARPQFPSEFDQDINQNVLANRMRRRVLDSVRQVDILEGLYSTDKAFAVFSTERARDKAVELCRQKQGLNLAPDDSDSEEEGERICQMQSATFEPETVKWAHFSTKPHHCVLRLLLGIVGIAAALVLWTVCCYLPYAMYVTSFSYARGERPTVFATFTFTMLVVAGNQTMYLVCRAVSEFAKFQCQDTTEMTYLTLYFLACLVNFAMDMAVTSYTTYVMMVGMGARTSTGIPLRELSGLQIFECYPMQRALGHFFFWYAFPSCFLVPFLVEPLLAIWLPGHIMELLVRSHPNVRGMEAERALQYFCPMDLSRYSDCLLNATIAMMSFIFPGSYIWKMFCALFVSQIYIICLDHYRVLRAVPACQFSTDNSEQCVQALTAIPIGLLLACIVLKYHSQERVARFSDSQILCTMFTAFVVHIIMHWFILFWLVPLTARDHEYTPIPYSDISRKVPCSWFSANPVHCLRSRYIKHHDPPCDFYFLGKEHLLKPNPEAGIYFQSAAAAVSPRHNLRSPRHEQDVTSTKSFAHWWSSSRNRTASGASGESAASDRPHA